MLPAMTAASLNLVNVDNYTLMQTPVTTMLWCRHQCYVMSNDRDFISITYTGHITKLLSGWLEASFVSDNASNYTIIPALAMMLQSCCHGSGNDSSIIMISKSDLQ